MQNNLPQDLIHQLQLGILLRSSFRSKEIIVVTTILDPQEASKEDLAKLYRSRWNQELDLRDIKVSIKRGEVVVVGTDLAHDDRS